MKAYTVGRLARMAGVSVRTLHHYDQIGLLKPSHRTGAGYRVYREQDLLRLQQILFFRELDVPLDQVRDILDDPGFDQVAALANQPIHYRLDFPRRFENLVQVRQAIVEHACDESVTA